MKNVLLAVGLFFTNPEFLFALEEQPSVIFEKPSDVTNQYGYIELGVLGPVFCSYVLPEIAVGYRAQKGPHGFDANLQIATLGFSSVAKFGLHYLHYFKPDVQNETYFGVGPAIGGCLFIFSGGLGGGEYAIAPEFILGKQYRTDGGNLRHIQANVIWPIIFSDNNWYSLFSISYAWGF